MNNIVYFGFMHILVGALLICCLLLWLRRNEGERSRKVLFAICFVVTFFGALFLIGSYMKAGNSILTHPFPGVLPIPGLLGGLIVVSMYLLYPIEVIHPGFLTTRRKVWLASGYILLITIFCLIPVCGEGYIQLNSFQEILYHITEFNVWIRVLLLIAVIFCSFVLLYIPQKGKVSNTNNQWVITYAIGTQGICILYAAYILSGEVWVRVLHLIYFTSFVFWVTYQELFIRLFRSPLAEIEDITVSSTPVINEAEAVDEKEQILWLSVQKYMREEEPWRDPNITLVSLADHLHTNRTTLSEEIHAHSYAHLSDFIASYRITEICRMIDNGEIENIDNIYFEVGYRSRSTAFENFKKQTGCTPGQYIKANQEKNINKA